jgi:rubredoxin
MSQIKLQFSQSTMIIWFYLVSFLVLLVSIDISEAWRSHISTITHVLRPSSNRSQCKQLDYNSYKTEIPLTSNRLFALYCKKEANEVASHDPYQQHQCPSCSYIYDEEKGFKKRYPPGTRLRDLKVFMCPVCGAAKEQFVMVQPGNK